MDEPQYVWEVTIPAKIEYKLYQACILVGIDIHDDYYCWFSDYTIINKADYKGLYADVIITCTDEKINELYHKLVELESEYTDIWLIDEVEEEIEEENETWQNQ